MATYDELFTLAGGNVLLGRITVAITIKADAILNDTNATASQKVWAKSAFINPAQQAKAFQNAVLASKQDATLAYNKATVAQIIGASNAAIQNAVNAAVAVMEV